MFDQLLDLTKTIIPLSLMASEGRMGYLLRAHSGSGNNCQIFVRHF